MEITSKLEWETIDWRKVESTVSKLQRRIFRASESGDYKLVKKLQKLLVNSQSAKLLATRKVTQENKGKKTAGVDGVKSLTPKQRVELAENLKLNGKSKPVRRVWIPKPGRNERRGLGIPTIEERAKQALMKLALEPEWEAKFEPNSYGFRLGRSCHDAIEAIRIAIQYKPKFVLDADIEKCFDQINQEKLIVKATQIPAFRKQIKAWLNAGVITDHQLEPTDSGTPQGGVISPLLANIALHGMEEAIEKEFPHTKARVIKNSKVRFGYLVQKPILVRYADDFVIMCEDLTVVQKCQEVINNWLKEWGLKLKESKTKIIHTLHEHCGRKAGFDFLGVNIRQYPVGKKHSNNFSNGSSRRQLGYKTLITPSKDSIKAHYKDLADTITRFNGKSQKELIGIIQRKITGWCNYYRPWNSKLTFSKLGHILWRRLWRWAVRRHRMKGGEWIMNKYWHTINGRKWIFAVKEDDKYYRLHQHDEHQAGARHIKVKDSRSPYDGDETYWCSRMGENYKSNDPQKARLMKKQKGKCHYCHATFKPDDLIEKHHVTPKSQGGKRSDNNMVLLHRHCHDHIHSSQQTDVVTG